MTQQISANAGKNEKQGRRGGERDGQIDEGGEDKETWMDEWGACERGRQGGREMDRD